MDHNTVEPALYVGTLDQGFSTKMAYSVPQSQSTQKWVQSVWTYI